MHLKDANHDGRYDGPGVTILQAWLKAMTTAVFKDELPAGVLASLTDLGYAPLTGARRAACSRRGYPSCCSTRFKGSLRASRNATTF
jgi:hypothetical protein